METRVKEQECSLAAVEVGDDLLVRCRVGQSYRYKRKRVTRIAGSVVVTRTPPTSATRAVGGQGVMSFRISDGREAIAGGIPARAWKMSDEGERILSSVKALKSRGARRLALS
jgi:hypothetical protein